MLQGYVTPLQSDQAYAGGHQRSVVTDSVSTGNGVKQDDVARVTVVLNTGVEEEAYGKAASSGVVCCVLRCAGNSGHTKWEGRA
jgi:hypothetical protein